MDNVQTDEATGETSDVKTEVAANVEIPIMTTAEAAVTSENNDNVMTGQGRIGKDNSRSTNEQQAEVKHEKKKTRKKKTMKKNPWDIDDVDYNIEIKKLKQSLFKGKNIGGSKKGGKQKDVYRGPYLHIKGKVHDPRCETIVNRVGASATNSKEMQGKSSISKADIVHKQLKKCQGGSAGNKWDASQVDYTWVCVFCGKQHNVAGLGDLFGPYIVNARRCNITIPTNVNKSTNTNTTTKGGEINTKRGTESATSSGSEKKSPKSKIIVLNSETSEVWVHQDCLIWSDGVYWVPGEPIRGLQESVKHAAKQKCSFCGQTGANIGCIGRGCSMQYHYLCARDTDCLLDGESFTVYCSKHRVSREKMSKGECND